MKKKKNIIIAAMLLTLVLPVRAQVFMMEDENNELRTVFGNGEWSNVIVHGSTDDQTNFVPIGNGMFVLTALGACSLMRKGKKTNK